MLTLFIITKSFSENVAYVIPSSSKLILELTFSKLLRLTCRKSTIKIQSPRFQTVFLSLKLKPDRGLKAKICYVLKYTLNYFQVTN